MHAMRLPRASGILLHPTSFPGPYGIGDLGSEAYRFVDFLHEAAQRVWQVLPLGPTGYGDSPYQSFGTFAGNPLLISLDKLVEEGLLRPKDLEDRPAFPKGRVDYGAVIPWKRRVLRRAYDTFCRHGSAHERAQFDLFCQAQADWLDDYALFMAIKEARRYVVWTSWPKGLALREPTALEKAQADLRSRMGAVKFGQYLFFKQWEALSRYVHGRGIRIVGDIPIYAAHDSADVWAHREVFQLDALGRPTVVGGVPPDYFSETGQLWGNPLFRWDYLAKTDYLWWVARVRAALRLFDVVRIDHFRGFEAYWEVPAGEPTAVNGRWVPGPGDKLFLALRKALGDPLPIIAENLGLITPPVEALREAFGLPGMAVFQFGYGPSAKTSSFPLHAFDRNLVAYTGTHDNDTLVGWWESIRSDRALRRYLLKYFHTTGREFHWVCIRALMASVADTVIFPLQDVQGLGSEARMNRPGHAAGNWVWRYDARSLTSALAARLADLAETYGRAGS